MAEGGGGVNFTDSSGSSYSYPSWATEETLTSVQSMLQGTPRYHSFMQKFATKMAYGGGDIADAMKHAAMGMEGYAEEVAAAKEETEGLTVSTGQASGSTFSLAKTAGMASTRLSSFADSAGRSDSSLKTTFDSVAKLVGMFTDGGGALLGMIPVVGQGISNVITGLTAAFAHSMSAVMGVADDFGQSLRKTGDMGISFAGSFIGLRRHLAEAGLGLENLEKQLALNSNAFALMGKNVHEGVRAWADWRKKMLSGVDMDFFRNLGFTLEDMNDYLLKDIRNRVLSGRALNDVTGESASALQWLAKETKRVSELTGESRKKMIAEQIRLASDPKWLAFLSAMDPAQAEEMQKSLGQIQRLYGFNEKQMDAVQDAIRMGGDVSLLADVFGDQFADYKYMPDALNDIQGVIKDVAQGNAMTDQQWRDRATDFNVKVLDFFDSSTGQWLSQYGQSLISMQGNLFNQYVQSTLLAGTKEKQEAARAGLDTYGLEKALSEAGIQGLDNAFLQSTENLAMILQQAFIGGFLGGPEEVIGNMLSELVQARKEGDQEGWNKQIEAMKSVMGDFGTGYGNLVGALAELGFEGAKKLIPMVDDTIQGIKSAYEWTVDKLTVDADTVIINTTAQAQKYENQLAGLIELHNASLANPSRTRELIRDMFNYIYKDPAGQSGPPSPLESKGRYMRVKTMINEGGGDTSQSAVERDRARIGAWFDSLMNMIPWFKDDGDPPVDQSQPQASLEATTDAIQDYLKTGGDPLLTGTRIDYNAEVAEEIAGLKETIENQGVKHGELLEQFVALTRQGNKERKEVALNTKNMLDGGSYG